MFPQEITQSVCPIAATISIIVIAGRQAAISIVEKGGLIKVISHSQRREVYV
jgi:hypothetical protein